MIFALNAIPVWTIILILAVVGVLAVIGAVVCMVLIIKHKKEDGIAVAEDAPAAQPLLPFKEEDVEEEIPEPASEPVAEEEAAEEHSETLAEPETALYEEPASEPVEEVVEEPAPEPVEEVIEEAPAEPEPVEEVAEEPVSEPVPEPVKEVVKTAPIIVRKAAPEGKVFIKVRYNRSYTAKLIQSEDKVKDYYTEIKNELLSYKVSNRTSWKYETFRRGRKLLVKLAVRGKSLYLYLALNPADYEGTKYKIKDVSNVASSASVPVLYKIKNDRRCKYAKQLIADVMAANELEAGAERNEDYAAQYPYEEIEPLVERGLIKLLQWEEAASGSEVGVIAVPVEELPANAVEADDEIAVTDVEEPDDEETEEPVEEEVVEEAAEEIVEEVAEEPVEEVVEVVEEAEPEPVQEEPVEEEEAPEEPEPVPEPEEPVGITVAEAEEQISDEEAESYVEISQKYSDKTKKAVINIDTLGRYFNDGETVTLDEIKRRIPDIGKKVTYIKVLARGKLDKALTVEADDFTPAAIKMIVLMGGKVIRKSTNIN